MKHTVPKWLNNVVFYEIYPQSFCDSNGDGIGDIQGIIDRLPYIQQLGCDAIWLNPCFDSNFDDAGYDIIDFYKIAPRYGTNEDMKRLCQAVHDLDMHILLDFVAGHTSYKCEWFQKSMLPEKNEYTDRYVWSDNAFISPEGFQCIRGISQRNGAAIVNFFSTQPALNYGFYEVKEPWQQPMNAKGPKATRKAMLEILKFWLGLGVDGFRVDMAGSLVKNDPEQKGTIALWNTIRLELNKDYPEAVLVSEWGQPERALEASFDMDFLLHFGPSHYLDLFRTEKPFFSKKGEGNLKEFVEIYQSNLNKTKGKGYICIPSSNHDMPRISYKLDDEELRVAYLFLLTMPGVPFIYYGDEIGMRYIKDLPGKEGGFSRTGSRTPMQWNHTTNAGFSAAKPDQLYLPIDPDKNRPTVEKQFLDENSLRNEIKKLIEFRVKCSEFHAKGEIEFLNIDYPLVYRRYNHSHSSVVILNPKDQDITYQLKDIAGDIVYSINQGGTITEQEVIIKGCSGLIINEY